MDENRPNIRSKGRLRGTGQFALFDQSPKKSDEMSDSERTGGKQFGRQTFAIDLSKKLVCLANRSDRSVQSMQH
ncbi:hypothetical protein BLOT_014000 [Blomia tropicalis]|nr:hypothetical protein BLOT_014000 [Blomia tropicalis]